MEFGRGDDIGVGKVFFVFPPQWSFRSIFRGMTLNLLPGFTREVKASFHSSGWKWGYTAQLGISMSLVDKIGSTARSK